MDIKCRLADLKPDAVIIVATVKALKYNGGVKKEDLSKENLDALKKGIPNLIKHIENIKDVFGLNCVVAINKFVTDSEDEIDLIKNECKKLGVNVALSEVWEKGAKGGTELANEVLRLCDEEDDFRFSYDLNDSIKEKIEAVATKIYGADGVEFLPKANKEIEKLESLGYGNLPICIAKNQYSLTDDPTKLGRPTGFNITVRDITLSAGAGFIVALTGSVMKMPGLPKNPAAFNIDVDENGVIKGLF